MVKIRRILCPIDFSPLSRRALDHAAALARLQQAEVTCLHVAPFVTVGLLPPEASPGVVSPDLTPELEAQFVSFVQPAQRRGVTLYTVVVPGDLACTIIASANALPADLLVVGIPRRAGVERVLLGSVAERVLPRVGCPVLAVPGGAVSTPASPPEAFRRILCAVDFSEASLTAVRYGASLAAATPDSSLTLIHVDTPVGGPGRSGPVRAELAPSRGLIERNLLWRLREAVPEGMPGWVRAAATVVSGAPSREVLKAAREREADLIVVGKESRWSFHRLFAASTMRRLLREAPCPVLAVGARAQAAEGGHDEGRHAA